MRRTCGSTATNPGVPATTNVTSARALDRRRARRAAAGRPTGRVPRVHRDVHRRLRRQRPLGPPVDLDPRALDARRDAVAAVGKRLRGGRRHPQVVEDDPGEPFVQPGVMLGRRRLPQVRDEVRRVGDVSRPRLVHQRAQRRVHALLADEVAQRHHHHRALGVVDVGLVVHPVQRRLLLAGAAGQVPAQLLLQHRPQRGLAVALLQDQQLGVARERLHDRRGAVPVGRRHLVAPPLVRDLVRGALGDDVHPALVAQVGEEAAVLGEVHDAGQREAAEAVVVGGHLGDAQGRIGIGPELRGEVLERRAWPPRGSGARSRRARDGGRPRPRPAPPARGPPRTAPRPRTGAEARGDPPRCGRSAGRPPRGPRARRPGAMAPGRRAWRRRIRSWPAPARAPAARPSRPGPGAAARRGRRSPSRTGTRWREGRWGR